MDDRIGVGEAGRHVLRPRQVTDDGTRGLHRHGARPPQQHAQPVAALGQLAQQPLTDETGRPGERDQRFDADRIHRWFGGWAVKHIWPRTLMVAVGLLIVALSAFQLARAFRFI